MSAVSWWGYGIAIAVMIVLLAGMVTLIRIISGDSDKYEELKSVLDPLFHTPAFLRPGEDGAGNRPDRAAAASSKPGDAEPFEDVCPACGEPVTHEHAECPSCGLRLLD